MLWTFLQSFSFIPLMASEAIFLNIFSKFVLSNQIQQFGQNLYVWQHPPNSFWGFDFLIFVFTNFSY